MNKFIELFINAIFISALINQANAQTAPVKGKGQAQSTYQTIERLETPNSGVTVTGDKAVLLETDKDNLLANPGFEHQTYNTGWTVSLGTPTVDTTNFFDGKKSMSISLTAANGTIAENCVTPSGQKQGINLEHSLRVKTTLTNLQVCAVQGTSEIQCSGVPSIDTWVKVSSTSVAPSSGALCVRLKSTSSATGTVKIDEGYVGINKTLGTFSQAKKVVQIEWSGSQTTNHDADTKVTFSGASLSKLENFTFSSGTLTATVPGDYLCRANVRQTNVVDAALMRQHITKFYKNGSLFAREGYIPGLAGNNINSGGTGGELPDTNPIYGITMAIGDTLEVYYYQSNGSGLNRSINTATIDCFYFPSTGQQVVSTNCTGTANCENIFTAIVSNADVVSNENVDWLNGNCTDAATGRATCIFNSSLFTVAPNCLAVANDSSSINQISCSLNGSPTTSQVGIDCKSNATDSNQNFTLICQRTGSDRKPLNQNPIFVGSVTSNYSNALRTEVIKGQCSASSSISFSTMPGTTIANMVSSCCDISLASASAWSSPQSRVSCVANRDAGTASGTVLSTTLFSTTGITVCISSGATTDFTMTCMGPK